MREGGLSKASLALGSFVRQYYPADHLASFFQNLHTLFLSLSPTPHPSARPVPRRFPLRFCHFSPGASMVSSGTANPYIPAAAMTAGNGQFAPTRPLLLLLLLLLLLVPPQRCTLVPDASDTIACLPHECRKVSP